MRLLFFALTVLFLFASCAETVPGCTDPSSPDYNPDATVDDGSCGFGIPESYTFERNEVSVVDLDETTLRQLLIQDLQLKIRSLAVSNTTFTTFDSLNNYLQLSNTSLTICTPVGQEVRSLDSVWSDYSTSANLSEKIVDIPLYFEASTQIPIWLDSIASWSQNGRSGTAAVYTSEAGLDLSTLIPIDLQAASLYAQAMDSLLPNIIAFDNVDFISGKNVTEMEEAWDMAFGYFGAARAYDDFGDGDLASTGAGSVLPFVQDADEDGKIDFRSEYNFSFARLAGARDLGSNGLTDFTQDIFDAWLLGRAAMAIGPGEEESIIAARDQILITWEQIAAATLVHHLNQVLEHLQAFDTPSFELESYRSDWAAMLGYGRMLGYASQGSMGGATAVQADILNLLGESPFTGSAGSSAWSDYIVALEQVRSTVGMRMGFGEGLLEGW